MSLKALPPQERPRERLLRDGMDALSIPELLAIILGHGTQGKSVIDLSTEILNRFGGLERLLEASVVELMEIKGIGQAKAIQLQAVLGIARRCRKIDSLQCMIASSEEAYHIAKGDIADYKQEVLLVMLRDVRGCLIHKEQVGVGTLSQVLAHPREIFYPAVRYKAHSFILAHNHPSGDPTPSDADIELTRCLIRSSQVMGISLDDHLIIGRDKYISLREKGYFGVKSKY